MNPTSGVGRVRVGGGGFVRQSSTVDIFSSQGITSGRYEQRRYRQVLDIFMASGTAQQACRTPARFSSSRAATRAPQTSIRASRPRCLPLFDDVLAG